MDKMQSLFEANIIPISSCYGMHVLFSISLNLCRSNINVQLLIFLSFVLIKFLVSFMFWIYNNKKHAYVVFYSYTVGVLRFGHAETLAPLYAGLGLFNDTEKLLRSNFKNHINRKFQAGKILPFSANIAFALFECDSENEADAEDDIEDSFYLKILVNEEPVEIPACGKTVCSYKQVKKYYQNFINCDYESICSAKKNDNTHNHDEL